MRLRWDRGGRWLPVTLLALASVLALASPAWAAARMPHDGSDSVTLTSNNGTNFTYGEGTQPKLTAVVTLGAKPTAGYFWTIRVQVDGVYDPTFGGIDSPTQGTDQTNNTTLTFSRVAPVNPIPAGQHTLTVTFNNPGTGTTVQSNGQTITIAKATADLTCGINATGSGPVSVGQSITVAMQTTHNANSSVPVDWQNGTYGVTLDGPTHLSYANLAPDGNDDVTVMGPSQPGLYTLKCSFSGTSNFTPATGDAGANEPFTFSAMHGLGTVQLYTNPATLVAHQNLTFYLVFHAAPGLPLPTGQFNIYIGNYYTNSMTIAANGQNLLQLGSLDSTISVTNIQVHYYGDTQYADTILTFPLTNPAIPSGTTGGGSPGGNGGPTATPGGTPTGTGTAATTGTATAETTPTTGSGGLSQAAPPSSGGGVPWLLILVAALVLAGLGVVGAVALRARRVSPQAGAGGWNAGASGGPRDGRWPLQP